MSKTTKMIWQKSKFSRWNQRPRRSDNVEVRKGKKTHIEVKKEWKKKWNIEISINERRVRMGNKIKKHGSGKVGEKKVNVKRNDL